MAADLNLAGRRLEHTVIIHALYGKDYFLAVSGEYGMTVMCDIRVCDVLMHTQRQHASETRLRLSIACRAQFVSYEARASFSLRIVRGATRAKS
jgi:hypothetical protein